MGRWSLGVVHVVFGDLDAPTASRRARDLGFEHLDVSVDDDEEGMVLPVGDRVSFPDPAPGCSTPAPARGEGAWDACVAAFRAAPGALLEPWPWSCVNTVAKARAIVDEVPGLRLLVDTGHVAMWGEDPCELLDLADHVQLRQARRGEAQTLEGDVDFRQVFRRLDQVGYAGKLSVEYFHLPDHGYLLDDPVGHAVGLAAQLRPLLERGSW